MHQLRDTMTLMWSPLSQIGHHAYLHPMGLFQLHIYRIQLLPKYCFRLHLEHANLQGKDRTQFYLTSMHLNDKDSRASWDLNQQHLMNHN